MMKKFCFIAISVAIAILQSESVSASPKLWRSQSGKTQIYNLDNPCYSITDPLNTQTAFGNNLYQGTIVMRTFSNYGCSLGDVLTGEFYLTHQNSTCVGLVTIMWKANDNVYLKWNISNSGSCNVTTKRWEINTYPVSLSSSFSRSEGVIFAPPSNIRETPNGNIICTIRSIININLLGFQQGWYQTDVCGRLGYIHESQVR